MKTPQASIVVVVTGCSGSGKTTALDAFEDAGFYCVDNLPAVLLDDLVTKAADSLEGRTGLALVMDLRDPTFLKEGQQAFKAIQRQGRTVRIVFLEADDKVLLRRYSQTRRRHPLAGAQSLLEAINREKAMLAPIRKLADHVLDTSQYSVHELKFAILQIAQAYAETQAMALTICSFGFKYGLPPEADLVMDVRFLANPYFDPQLKDLDGESEPVRSFVLRQKESDLFLRQYIDLIESLIPLYEREGKAYLTLAVGCTGGRHRSVVIARELYRHFQARRPAVRLIHRDIG